jgi:hypothetical protein
MAHSFVKANVSSPCELVGAESRPIAEESANKMEW